jgi:3-deoxy-D-manno-octulosonic-acid transferase
VRVTRAVYTAALAALVTGYAPVALYRRLARGVPLNLGERLGRVAGFGEPGPRAWVHAVSVGEAIAAEPLLTGLRRAYPALPLVVTTVTETGARVVRQRYAGLAEHRYFPLDFSWCVRRAVRAIDPACLICMETELWPNALRGAAAAGAPVMVANGRISDRSFRGYARVRRLLGPLLDDVRVFAMQSEEDARRIVALGAPPARVFVTGNLKNEAAPADDGSGETWRRRLGLGQGDLLWVAGSTHAGEEDAVLDAHAAARTRWPGLALVVAPRHPERVSDVLALVSARGWQPVRRTALTGASGSRTVVVLDTIGELASLYAAADVVFVGGSLVPAGGHNVLEPAFRRRPVLFGPHTTNFREAAAGLLEAGAAVIVPDAPALGAQLQALLADPGRRAAMGARGREAAASRSGAARTTLDLIERFLNADGRLRRRRVAS